MATQLSAPQMDAQRVMKKMSMSSCRFRLSIRGSSMNEKCEMMDVVGIAGFFMLLNYHNMEHKALLFKDIFNINKDGFHLQKINFISTKFALVLSK